MPELRGVGRFPEVGGAGPRTRAPGAGTSNVERCRESMARMESGVSLLEVDRVACGSRSS